MDNLYAGYFVRDGKLVDLMVYPNIDCARDTLRDSMIQACSEYPEIEITDAGICRVDTDGSCEQVETVSLPFEP